MPLEIPGVTQPSQKDTVDGVGNRVTMGYDAASRQVTVKNPLGNVSTTLYDAVSRVRAIIDPLLKRTSMAYDVANQRTAVIDPNAHRTTTVYDAAGRSVATVSALGNRATTVYDTAGRRTAIVDARANRYTFGYDNASRQVKQTDPLSRVTSFGFDGASQRTLRIDARGNRSTYVYDSDSRLTGTRYPDSTRVTMAYDAVGNRRFLADATGRYTTLYDSMNRARAVTTPANLTISLSFDSAGRRKTMVEPGGGTFTYGYDLANRSTLVVNPQSERTSWTYDAASRATIQRLSNLIRVSMAYDTVDRLVRLANITSTGTTITSFRDTWDGAGNRLHRVEADGTLVTWTYDGTNQLTRERRNGGNSYDTTYSYDAAGNRLATLDNAGTTYTCDAANQLNKKVDSSGHRTTFSYDASGSQRTLQVPGGGITTNTWDFENRLTKIALPSGTLNTFTYNGDGQRVKRQDSTGTLKEVWDGRKILLETDSSDVPQVIYSSSSGFYGDLISQRRSGVSRYFLFDPLGSAIRLTDGNQSVTDSYLVKAFGESLLGAQPTTNPFQFVGQLGYYRDTDLGLYFVQIRNLDPVNGRWILFDPFGVLAGDLNFARYVGNVPTHQVDPSGLWWVCCTFKGGFISVTTWSQEYDIPLSFCTACSRQAAADQYCSNIANSGLYSWTFISAVPGKCPTVGGGGGPAPPAQTSIGGELNAADPNRPQQVATAKGQITGLAVVPVAVYVAAPAMATGAPAGAAGPDEDTQKIPGEAIDAIRHICILVARLLYWP